MSQNNTKERPYVGVSLATSFSLCSSKIKLSKSTTRPSREPFSSFALLPYEIREAIWVATCTDAAPRVVEVGYYQAWNNGDFKFPSKTVVPAILHVISEARAIGLTHYVVFTPCNLWSGTYMNWNLDYIYLNWLPGECDERLQSSGWSNGRPSIPGLTDKCQHLLLNVESAKNTQDWFKIQWMFSYTKDIAVLYGRLRKAKLSSKHIKGEIRIGSDDDEGGFIQLFDIEQDNSGLTAVPIASFRGVYYPVTPSQGGRHSTEVSFVMAHLRKRRLITPQERTTRDMLEDKMYRQNPIPLLPPAYSSSWNFDRLKAEAEVRGITKVTLYAGMKAPAKGWERLRIAIKADDAKVKLEVEKYEKGIKRRLQTISYTCRDGFKKVAR
jgi:hypothetical protein